MEKKHENLMALPAMTHLLLHDLGACHHAFFYALGMNDPDAPIKLLSEEEIYELRERVNQSIRIARKFASYVNRDMPKNKPEWGSLHHFLDGLIEATVWRWPSIERVFEVPADLELDWLSFRQMIVPNLIYLNQLLPQDATVPLKISTCLTKNQDMVRVRVIFEDRGLFFEKKNLHKQWRPFKEGLDQDMDIDMVIAAALGHRMEIESTVEAGTRLSISVGCLVRP